MRGWVVSPIVGTGTDLDPYRPQVMDRPAVDGDRLDIVIGTADRCLVAAEVEVNNFAQFGGLLLCLEEDFDAPFSSLPPPVRNALNRIGGTGTTIRERVRSAGLLLDPNFHEGRLLGATAAPPTGSFVDDTFTDTDAVLLQNHTPSPTGTSWTKASYAVSDLRVTSNRIRPGGNGTLALCYATPAAAGPEQVVEAVVRVVSNPAGVAANTGISGRRSTSADDGYDCYVNKDAADVGTINMRKRVAAVSTVLATYATTLTVSSDITIKLSLWDSVKRFYVNGTERGSSTDNVHTGTGRVAAFAFQGSGVGDAVGYHIDSFVATDLAAPTYPTVAGTTEGGLTSAGTSLPVTLPAGGASTDEYIVIVAKGSIACTINALTDWTELLDENTSAGLAIIRYTGTGVPSDPTFVQSTSSRSVWGAYRISGADKSIAPQIGTTSSASSVSVDAPAVTVTGGPKDILSIACFARAGEQADDDSLVTTFPTGYTLGQIEKTGGISGTNLCGVLGSAARQVAAASSEDPPVFTIVIGLWRAQTIVFHPAPSALNLSATGGAATASGGTVALAATWTAATGTATAAGGTATASTAGPPVDLSAAAGTAAAGGGTVALARTSVAASGAAAASGGTVGCAFTLAVTGAAGNYRTTVMATSGLAGYWRLGEPSGTSANDEVGTNDGTLDSGVTFGGAGALAGDADTAASFDGSGDSEVVFASPGLTAPFSLEAWVYNTGPGTVGATDWAAVFGYSPTRRILFDTDGSNGNKLLVQMGGANLFTPTSSIARNAWFHIVYTYGSGTETVYLNGVEAASQATASGPSWDAAFIVGAYNSNPATNYAFKGRIDEPAIYSAALSPGTVAAHYAAGVTAAGTVAGGGSATASQSSALSATGGAATATGGTVALARTSLAAAGAAVASGGTVALSSTRVAAGGLAAAGGGTVALAATRVAAAGVATAGGGALTLAASLVAAGGTSAATGGAATATVGAGASVTAANGTAAASGGTVLLSAALIAASGTATAGGGTATFAKAYFFTAAAGIATASGSAGFSPAWAASSGQAMAAGGAVSLAATRVAASGLATAAGGTVALAATLTAATGAAAAGGGTVNANIGAAVTVTATNGLATAGGGTLTQARQHVAAAGVASASGGTVTFGQGTAVTAANGTAAASGAAPALSRTHLVTAGTATATGGTVSAAQVGALTAAGGTATTGGTVVLSTGWLSVAGTAAATGGVVSTTRALPVASGAATATGVGVTPTWVYLAATGTAYGAGGAAAAFVSALIPPGLIEAAGSAGGLLDWGGTGTTVEPGGSSTGLDGTGGVPVLVE